MKYTLPVVVIILSVISFNIITASEQETIEYVQIDSRPIVNVEEALPTDHQVIIKSYGEVTPLESTLLSSEVSGKIIYWNPKFVAGGLVKNSEILFSIEKDNYEAGVIESEAKLLKAQATLAEELANAKVAEQEANRSPHLKHSDLYLRKPQLLSARADVKSAKALLRRARKELKNCDVKSPYAALVISKKIGLGQYVSAGDEVGVLNNIEFAEVLIPIAGFESNFLPEHLESHNAVVTRKGEQLNQRSATISRGIGLVDSETRMSSLAVLISDPYSLHSTLQPLKFGSYVEVRLKGKILKQVYRLPQRLINNSVVWVVDENNELVSKKVNVIKEDGEFFIIKNGLNQKDKVVVTLPDYPRENMEVKVLSTELISPQLLVNKAK